jgi:glycosyltransferase involved in cell wall biosynthesis
MTSPEDEDLPLLPPKVSVCVITYNQERYIRRCLQSLIDQQTSFDFEVVVGDDCSTDSTRTVVQEFVERYPAIVRALYQERNTGGSRNNLELHAAATGEYVAHVDGDDYALPGKLQAQADVLDRDAACVAVWHRVDFFDDRGGFCSGKTADFSSFELGRVTFADAIRLGFIGVHSSLMYRRTARSRIDTNRRILDVYVTWDLLSKGHGQILDEVLGRYRVSSSGSLTMASQRAIRMLAIDHAREFLSCFPQHRPDFMIWALCRALYDVKQRCSGALDYLSLAWDTRSVVSFGALTANLRRMRRTQVRWRHLRQQDPRATPRAEDQ